MDHQGAVDRQLATADLEGKRIRSDEQVPCVGSGRESQPRGFLAKLISGEVEIEPTELQRGPGEGDGGTVSSAPMWKQMPEQ